MTKEEIKVCSEAVLWWRNRCPSDFTEEQHLDFPTINCASEYEIRLAEAVGKLLKLKP